MFAVPDAKASAAATSTMQPSPEMEQILTSLTSHRSVLGYMLLSRGHPVTIIRHSGVVFEGEQGRKYAHAVSRIVESVQAGLEEVSSDPSDTVSRPSVSAQPTDPSPCVSRTRCASCGYEQSATNS